MVFRGVLTWLVVLLILCGSAVTGSWAGISISPAYVEVDFDKGRPAGQFIISNLGDEEERYRIKATHFTFAKDGSLERIEPDGRSLAPWIKFNPTEFVLGPKSKRSIRFVIAPQGNLRTGEYWGAMELESLKTSTATGKDKQGREYNLEVISTIMVPIFGKFGNVRYIDTLSEVKLIPTKTGASIGALFANQGEGRILLDLKYGIKNGAGEEVQKESLGKGYVLPGLESVFSTSLKSNLPEGTYKVWVEGRSPQLKEPIRSEVDVVWKPTK